MGILCLLWFCFLRSLSFLYLGIFWLGSSILCNHFRITKLYFESLWHWQWAIVLSSILSWVCCVRLHFKIWCCVTYYVVELACLSCSMCFLGWDGIFFWFLVPFQSLRSLRIWVIVEWLWLLFYLRYYIFLEFVSLCQVVCFRGHIMFMLASLQLWGFCSYSVWCRLLLAWRGLTGHLFSQLWLVIFQDVYHVSGLIE